MVQTHGLRMLFRRDPANPTRVDYAAFAPGAGDLADGLERGPLGRINDPEDIVNAVAFLVS